MLYFSVFIAFCGSFLFGYTTCIIAGALLFLSQQFNLSNFQQGILVSITLFGAMIGSLAIAYHLDNGFLGTVALVTPPLYTAFFTIGMGSALWVYLSEMFPSTIRSQAMSLAAFINWLGNYLISLVFPALAKAWGVGGVFTMFALISHLPPFSGD